MEFKVRTPTELIESVDERTGLIDQLNTAAGMKGSQFEDFYKPLITQLAEYVLECPLERDAYAEPCGALRFGMTSALFALRHTTTKVFANGQGSERRRQLTEQYKFAAFAAALASVPATVHARVQVSTGEPGKKLVWNPYHRAPQLYRWLREVDSRGRYEIAWRTDNVIITQANAVAFSADIFRAGTWVYFDYEVIRDMYDAIAPAKKTGKESPLWLTVYEGETLAREFERKAAVGPYTPAAMPPGVSSESVAAIVTPSQPASPAAAPAAQPNPATASESTAATTQPSGDPSTPTEAVAPGPAEAPGATSAPAPNPVHEKAREMLSKAPPHVAEVFTAIRLKADYENLRKTWTVTEEGSMHVTVDTVKGLGRSPGDIVTDLKDHKFCTGHFTMQAPKRTILVLTPETAAILLGEVDAHVQ
ncbi:TraI domain-containing protein [Paraburkholderia sp. SIMBA_054]|uniref:TraI domain-containing protein n=1 Tax=Paraburkholderia sp. SIMBA_054 TaxID=3085795 RepID=UPI0039788DC8